MGREKIVKGHKRECHKCPYNGKGDSECLRCSGPSETSYKGVSYVFLDAQPEPEGIIAQRIDKQAPQRDRFAGKSVLPVSVEEALVPILATFFSLTDQEMLVFRHKYLGEDDPTCAKALGVSKQRINAIVHSICERNPIIARVIQAMRISNCGSMKRVGTLQRIKSSGVLFAQVDSEKSV